MTAPQEKTLADFLYEAERRQPSSLPTRSPIATYRVQMHKGFRLGNACEIVPYLHDLGVSDLYTSPYLDARPGSVHGYDVFDHGRINPEVGGNEDHARLVDALRSRGMGRVLDLVPNHMGVKGPNRFWLDVLEMGPHSPYADFFDIDWHPIKAELRGRVLLPILEDQYGVVLEDGKLELVREGGKLFVQYHDTRLPVSPESYAPVLGQGVADLVARFEADDPLVQEYMSVANSAESLSPRSSGKIEDIDRRMRERFVIRNRLERMCADSGAIREVIDAAVRSFHGDPGDRASFDRMHEFLELQVYRLAFWKVASQEINYRRFFDINDLAGLRMENPHVFDLTHELILRWVDEGNVTGLRIDHPDGLADPAAYFRSLQEAIFLLGCRNRFDAEGHDPLEWLATSRRIRKLFRDDVAAEPHSSLAQGFPVVVEKILSHDEAMPEDWPIGGTVGYEYLNVLNGVFVDGAAREAIGKVYAEFTGDAQPFAEVLYEAKTRMAHVALASEVNTLARQLSRVSERDRRSRDFTLEDLRLVIRETIACFPVYRTYLVPGEPPSARDRGIIEQAVADARRRAPSLDPTIFDFVRKILLLDFPEGTSPEIRSLAEVFVRRFQQTTGPIQAKGLEDTAFYRQFPLLSLNEVGADPSRFGNPPDDLHEMNRLRLAQWPGTLGTTATHDTKRGEDARIRIDVLSELPAEWRQHLARWGELNANLRLRAGHALAPDRREEYFLYQTLIGSWPLGMAADSVSEDFVQRIQAYMVKAAREAKVNTSWSDPDPSYAEALAKFVGEILQGPESGEFLREFLPFQARVGRVAVVHSLAQTLLKVASPGVPDTYQGCELWDWSLVDPDNRRPVDYEFRIQALRAIHDQIRDGKPRHEVARSRLDDPRDGAIKLYVTTTALTHRRENPELYAKGEYLPLKADGEHAAKVIGFARRHEGHEVMAVAPRLVASLMGPDGTTPPLGPKCWGDTRLVLPEGLEGGAWRDLLSDRRPETASSEGRKTLALGDLFQDVPVALLVRSDA